MAKPPRIVGTRVHPEHGALATVDWLGSPKDPYVMIEVPADTAPAIVELACVVHEQTQDVVRAIFAGDPEWRARVTKVIGALAKLERAHRGRPRCDHELIRRVAEECRRDGTFSISEVSRRTGHARSTISGVLTPPDETPVPLLRTGSNRVRQTGRAPNRRSTAKWLRP